MGGGSVSAYSNTGRLEWVLLVVSSDRVELPKGPARLDGKEETWNACSKKTSMKSERNMIYAFVKKR